MESRALNFPRLWLGLGFAVLVGIITFNAWVSEDAYITFRVIDNALHGYGLRWNSAERVQAYTHPLWLLLQLPLAYFSPSLFINNIGLSILCSSLACWIAARAVEKPAWQIICFFFLPLAASKFFIDYATSGLENPLSYLLYACSAYVLLRWRAHSYFWFALSFCMALSLVNRLDTVLFFFPLLACLLMREWRNLRIWQVMAGSLPLLAWFAFSLIYYGFFLPNTQGAKLGTGLELSLYLSQGIEYATSLVTFDLLGGAAILVAALFWHKSSDIYAPFLAAGLIWYGLYVVYIGGDYMIGRFWALPVFAAIFLCYAKLPASIRPDHAFALVIAIIMLALAPQFFSELRKPCNCLKVTGRVLDAKHTFGGNRLVAQTWPPRLRTSGSYAFGKKGRALIRNDPAEIKPLFFIGMMGYYAGIEHQFIDTLALADPLLSRLPARDDSRFYVGHFRRAVPAGYRHALETGDMSQMDADLARYLEKLRIITRDPLFSRARFATILAFHMGQYNAWREAYVARQKAES